MPRCCVTGSATSTASSFLVAGPPAMTEAVADSLHGAGVPEDGVLVGKFSGY